MGFMQLLTNILTVVLIVVTVLSIVAIKNQTKKSSQNNRETNKNTRKQNSLLEQNTNTSIATSISSFEIHIETIKLVEHARMFDSFEKVLSEGLIDCCFTIRNTSDKIASNVKINNGTEIVMLKQGETSKIFCSANLNRTNEKPLIELPSRREYSYSVELKWKNNAIDCSCTCTFEFCIRKKEGSVLDRFETTISDNTKCALSKITVETALQ